MAYNRFQLPFVFGVNGIGQPYENAYLLFFETDQVTQKTTYADKDLTTPSTTVPIIYGGGTKQAVQADASGKFPTIFLTPDEEYYVVYLDENLNTIKTENYISTPKTTSDFAPDVFVDVGGSEFPAIPLINITTTNYTLTSSTSWGRLITLSNASAISVTLPSPTGSTFINGWYCHISNIGESVATITSPANINGLGSLVILGGQSALICSNGTTYYTDGNIGNSISSTNTIYRDRLFTTTSPATTTIGGYRYYGKDSASNQECYATTDVIVDDDTSGSEDASYNIWAAIGGAVTKIAQFAATITFNRVVSALAGLIGLETAQQAYTNGTAGSVAHGLGRTPFMIQAVAVCTTTEGDYSVGNELLITSSASTSSSPSVTYGFAVYTDDTTNIKWRASSDGILATRKTSSQAFVLTPANWRIKFKYL